jgi:benzil reductase ((S)-benzoin forming)
VLINNAGSLDPVGRFDSIDLSVTNRTMMLNGLAPILVSQTFYQAVLAAPTCTGRIIQITSGAALRPIAGWTSYCMSKAAMWMGTQVMAEEMDVTRCQVMALSPGVVATAMQTQIRGETEASMPGVAWFRQIAAEGKLADPSVPALRIRAMLSDDATGRKAFPHGESVDLFAA